MIKAFISFSFAIILTGLSIAPTLISMFDCDYEVSILMDGEEEEKEGKESSKVKDIELIQENEEIPSDFSDSKNAILDSYTKNYTSSYKELTSPPPEYTLL